MSKKAKATPAAGLEALPAWIVLNRTARPNVRTDGYGAVWAKSGPRRFGL